MQLSNLLGNNVSGKAVMSESFLYVDILKNSILELEKQLSENNTIILKIYQKVIAVTTLSKEITLIEIKIMTCYMKKKALKIYQTE